MARLPLSGAQAAALTLALLAGAVCGRAVQVGAGQPKSQARPNSSKAQVPPGPTGAKIRLGQQVFEQTAQYAKSYVGNQMKCADCHLAGGRAPYSAPLVGIPSLFPSYFKRAGRVITLTERIQECFVRSENGQPPPARSPEMEALLAYMDWISRAQPKGVPPAGRGLVKLPTLHGDPVRGAEIYAKQCSDCHGDQGEGVPPVLPPLWGPTSFNNGAGMSHAEKMAAFVQHNMPQDAPGSLTAQQAYDVAAYVDSKPRPKMDPAYEKY